MRGALKELWSVKFGLTRGVVFDERYLIRDMVCEIWPNKRGCLR